MSAMLPPPIPQHLLVAVQAARSTTSSHPPIPTATSVPLPCTPNTPSAPDVIELADCSPPSARHNDPLYFEYDPYAEGRDDSKCDEEDDGAIRMYEVELNDRPRLPPPLPPRPHWSPSVTLREQSDSSASSTPRRAISTSSSTSPFRYVHSSDPNRPPTVLDPQQLTARTLTTRAVPLWFRIHNTVLRLHPVAFDDLPEMTLWLNRAKFTSDRIIHDRQGRVLCSLRWLMSSGGEERFGAMCGVLREAEKRRKAHVLKGLTCNMQYFFYGDDVGFLYTEWRIEKGQERWGDEDATSDGKCCVIS